MKTNSVEKHFGTLRTNNFKSIVCQLRYKMKPSAASEKTFRRTRFFLGVTYEFVIFFLNNFEQNIFSEL